MMSVFQKARSRGMQAASLAASLWFWSLVVAMGQTNHAPLPVTVTGANTTPSLASSLVVRSWSTRSGLPQNTINAITRTRDGYLWLGTQDGLARFDGLRFTTFGLVDGLESVEIQTLLEDTEGALWIGTRGGGLSRYLNGRFETFNLPSRILAGNTITCLAQDKKGMLWIGTGSGLTFWENGEFQDLPACDFLDHRPIRSLLKSKSGGMWIATGNDGLFEYKHEKLTFLEGPPEATNVLAYCLLEDKTGSLWAGIGNGRLLCRQKNDWKMFTKADGIPYAYITCLAEDRDGHIWAGSLDDGLHCLQNGRFEPIHSTDGLSANDIRSLCSSPEGDLWVGTRTTGLNQLRKRRLFSVSSAEGLTNEFTRSTVETRDGRIWTGTLGTGVFRSSPTGFKGYSVSPLMDFYSSIESILPVSDGSVWLGGARALMQVRDDKLTACYTNENWIQATWVTALCEDPLGGLWVGTQLGRLVHIRDQSAQIVKFSVGQGSVTALAAEPKGGLWIGTTAGGLKWLPPGGDRVISMTNGLLSRSIRTLRRDGFGVLWIGTAGGGLSRWQAGRAFTYSSQHGLDAKTVLQIVDDSLGYLWLGCSRGILRVAKSDLEDVAAGRKPYLHPITFGANEGMLGEECTGGFTPAGLRTGSGLICISTVRGLVFIDPTRQPPPTEAPKVWIESVKFDGADTPLKLPVSGLQPDRLATSQFDRNNGLQLKAGQREIEIQYTGINFSAPEMVRFRYKMEGLDNDWVDADTRRTAYYRLPAGTFHFKVQARTADGEWSETSPNLRIAAPPFIWETPWFKAVLGIVIIGSIAALLRQLVRRRYQRQLATLRTRHAIERERLRISKDMHDDIGSTLTQVAQLTEIARGEPGLPGPVQIHLERIRLQARAAVQALDEIVWATNPRNDNLPRFAEYLCRFADECFEMSSTRLWIEIPTDLPAVPLRADLRHNLFLAVKEAMNNVLKHSGAQEAWLRLRLNAGVIELEIEDSGRGFNVPPATATDPADAPSPGQPPQNSPGRKPPESDTEFLKPSPREFHRNGLGNMRSRLRECGGTTEITSIPNKATRIRFSLPLPEPASSQLNPNVV